ITLPCCTRRLWPRPIIFPRCTITEPMGIPPSASPALASSIAACINSSIHPPTHLLSSAQYISRLEQLVSFCQREPLRAAASTLPPHLSTYLLPGWQL